MSISIGNPSLEGAPHPIRGDPILDDEKGFTVIIPGQIRTLLDQSRDDLM